MTAGDDAVVGVVGKPIGIRGEVYVRPDPDIADAFAPGSRYRCDGPSPTSLTVTSSRLHSGRQIVHFSGVDDREGAEALRGAVLTVPRSSVALDADTFWADDLLGREVVDPDGAVLGTVEGVSEGTAHDFVIVALSAGGEAFVPAVDAFLEVTPEAVVVRPIPGLLE